MPAKVNSYFKPSAGFSGDIQKPTSSSRVALQAKIVVRKGAKVVFKHIDICTSEEERSEDEDDFVPKRNFDIDSSDDSSDESAESGKQSDDEEKLQRINENLPLKSKLDRKRNVKTSKGVYKWSTKQTTRSCAKSVYNRAKEFAASGLTIFGGKLCCRACSMQEISLKSSSIKSHIGGERHEEIVRRRDKSQLTQLSYKAIVLNNETEEFAAEDTLPLDKKSYRMSVTHAFLNTGTPFTLLNSGYEMRQLIEDSHASCPKNECMRKSTSSIKYMKWKCSTFFNMKLYARRLCSTNISL